MGNWYSELGHFYTHYYTKCCIWSFKLLVTYMMCNQSEISVESEPKEHIIKLIYFITGQPKGKKKQKKTIPLIRKMLNMGQ